MKKTIVSLFALTLASCGTTAVKSAGVNKLYEVLTQQITGGATIRFFEILSEPNEIKMLQNDESLKNKISANDVQNSNFVILNMGEKTTGGYAIGIENIVETDKNIIITVKETNPESGSMVTQSLTTPFCVVKINSKKEIVFK
ncbi:protease complex subunit PrcB family protein [Flavobacterium sandaracinum]|uniref:Protease complex subunit PrcB family protein n=1 Tax=Flavobacterium sandaracinum TaxID=2541733 RepID=A0A4R5CY13_9FLAO|nr:protease complex subunit PrcB family protein [Flavobacterium sandaracinum]TDE02743.1 protease complex subunit PrcB family protein [Flavobacterium sandaracinum]